MNQIEADNKYQTRKGVRKLPYRDFLHIGNGEKIKCSSPSFPPERKEQIN